MARSKACKPVHEHLAAIVKALEYLATDIEILREGTEGLIPTLPKGCEAHGCVLKEQSSALERISIALGMIQATAENLLKP